jgi:hypothetical protein
MPAHRLIPSRLAEQAVPTRRRSGSRTEAIEGLRQQAAYLRVRLRAVPGHEALIVALEQRRRSLERLAETEARMQTEMVMVEAARDFSLANEEGSDPGDELNRRLGELRAEEAQLEARWRSERRAFGQVKRRLDHRVAARFHGEH